MTNLWLENDGPFSVSASLSPASKSVPSRGLSRTPASPTHESPKAPGSPSRRTPGPKTPRSPTSKSRRRQVPIKENAYMEGTYHLSPFDVLKRTRTFVDSTLGTNSNLRCNMLTTIVPNSEKVVESELSKSIAVGAGSIGLIAQVVLPEIMFSDKDSVREAVNSARRNFSHDGTGQAFAAVAKAQSAPDHFDIDSVENDSDSEKEEKVAQDQPRRINRLGGLKGKRPEFVNIPARPIQCMNDQPETLRDSKRSKSQLPSSFSPKWLQNLLHEPSSASRGKRPWASPRSPRTPSSASFVRAKSERSRK